jgi:RNA polymerase sigma-70 factor, ECF subfamily
MDRALREASFRAGEVGAPDHELVRSVLAGETEKYAVLVRRYQGRLYRYALGMVSDGDAAADLVQDAFVRSYENLGRFQDRSTFGTWLFRILRNRCLDYLKEHRRADVPLGEEHAATIPGRMTEFDLERLTLRDVLDRALARLPEAQREAFILKHVHDLTYDEMSEVVGASVSALRMRVMRAREMLQELLGDGRVAGGETTRVGRLEGKM